MNNGEIPPHWEDLVTSHSESVTDEKIELANTWANALSPEMIEDTPLENDVNLKLTRSYNPSQPIPSSSSSNANTTNDSISHIVPLLDSEGDNSALQHRKIPRGKATSNQGLDNLLLMPAIPDLDALTSRRSTRTQSAPKRLNLFTSIPFAAMSSVFASIFHNLQSIQD